jgi:Tol biopolymer transport system component
VDVARWHGVLAVAVAGSAAVTAGPAHADVGTTTRVSVSSDGAQGNEGSYDKGISADGRYIAFHSAASNLVPGDTNDRDDVFVRDVQAGTTTRVSVAGDGAQADGDSSGAAMSTDGRYITFTSDAANLVPEDTDVGYEVFVRDVQAGTTTRVSVSGDEAQADSESFDSAISADGRYIAFTSYASNLVPGDTNQTGDVFVRDQVEGTTTLVSVSSDARQQDNRAEDVAISADGRYVAFTSWATNLVPGDTNDGRDVFLRDRTTGTTSRVSVAGDGTQADAISFEPEVSADGRYVAFDSGASNLVPGDTNGALDVFLRDRTSS